jgi:hypothetical protein
MNDKQVRLGHRLIIEATLGTSMVLDIPKFACFYAQLCDHNHSVRKIGKRPVFFVVLMINLP